MRAHHMNLETHALAQDQRQNKAAQARTDMHCRTARKIDSTNCVFVANKARTPNHMGHWGIYHHRPHHQDEGEGSELHAARQGARNNCSGNHRERRLESNIN